MSLERKEHTAFPGFKEQLSSHQLIDVSATHSTNPTKKVRRKPKTKKLRVKEFIPAAQRQSIETEADLSNSQQLLAGLSHFAETIISDFNTNKHKKMMTQQERVNSVSICWRQLLCIDTSMKEVIDKHQQQYGRSIEKDLNYLDFSKKLLMFNEENQPALQVSLVERKMEAHVEELMTIQNLIKRQNLFTPGTSQCISLKGGFAAFVTVSILGSSKEAANGLPINDIDGTIFSSEPGKVKELLESRKFSLTREQKDKSDSVIYYLMTGNNINNVPIELTVAYCSQNPDRSLNLPYRGNQIISVLASSEVSLTDNYTFSITNKNSIDLVHQVCHGLELYSKYNYEIHKKYCVVMLKSHLKSLKIKEATKIKYDFPTLASQNLYGYDDALHSLYESFIALICYDDRGNAQAPVLEVIALLKTFPEISNDTKPYLFGYFFALCMKQIKLRVPISDLSSFASYLANDVINYLEKNFSIIEYLSQQHYLIENAFTILVDLLFDFRVRNGSLMIDNAKIKQWNDILSAKLNSNVSRLSTSHVSLRLSINPVSSDLKDSKRFITDSSQSSYSSASTLLSPTFSTRSSDSGTSTLLSPTFSVKSNSSDSPSPRSAVSLASLNHSNNDDSPTSLLNLSSHRAYSVWGRRQPSLQAANRQALIESDCQFDKDFPVLGGSSSGVD
jgi:hypothetical protein